MAYPKLKYRYLDREVEIELTPETLLDFKTQLDPQLSKLSIVEVAETMEALGIGPKTLAKLLGK